MDYRNSMEPIEDGCKEVTVADALQEANKILNELNTILTELCDSVVGKEAPDNGMPRNPSCLLEDARYITGLSYNCMCKAKRIKDVLI